MPIPELSIVVAMDKKRGIGVDGQLPWQLPADMRYFKSLTETAQPGKRNIVIMGRKTWESLPKKFRPLPKRLNIVLSRDPSFSVPDGVIKFASLDTLLNVLPTLFKRENIEKVFVIGGARIYESLIKHPACKRLFITEIDHEFECDAFFPDMSDSFVVFSKSDVFTDNKMPYQFLIYHKKTKIHPNG